MTLGVSRRRSLTVLAFLSLGMVIASYAIILLIAATCALVPIWIIANSSANLQVFILLACGLAIAGTLLWSLVPRRDKFREPGPTISRSSHPRLFAELQSISESLNEPLPEEVFLIPQVNAFVTDRGGVLGFGSRRVMGIGLPLVAILTVTELRAVLAHEFAHYYSGDTRLGPFVYKTRMAMVRTIQNMASMRGVMRVAVAAVVYTLVMWILQGYWKLFFWITQLVSRKQEYRADELACRIAGSEALISGLKKIHGGNAAFPAYWNFEVSPFLAAGFRLPITEGFERFVGVPEISMQMQQQIEKELEKGKTNGYESHPPLRDRVASARLLQLPPSSADSSPARVLFNDLRSEEARLLEMSTSENSADKVAALKPLEWSELPAILPRLWFETVSRNAHLLGDLTPDGIPDVISKLPEIGSQIPDPKGMLLTPQQRTARATELIGTALALAVVNAGWELHMTPGERYYQLETERFSIRDFLGQLLTHKISREEWVERCRTLKIAGMRLASAESSPQMAMFQSEGNV